MILLTDVNLSVAMVRFLIKNSCCGRRIPSSKSRSSAIRLSYSKRAWNRPVSSG